MKVFERDPNDWLRRFSPDEWIRAAMHELGRAEKALAARHTYAIAPGCKRAAGMALNAILILKPDASWGRTYVEHLKALCNDASAPAAVRSASQIVLEARAPGGGMVMLVAPSATEALFEATRDVIAHAYAIVRREENRGQSDS